MTGLARRGFLKLFGTSAVAAPLAAKAAADAAMASQMGIANISGLATGGGTFTGPEVGLPPYIPAVAYEKQVFGALEYIKLFGIPEVVDAELRDRAQWIGGLDPDIACKKSWSMNVKIMTQRQRNYERQVENLHKRGWQHKKREGLKKILGFEWPW